MKKFFRLLASFLVLFGSMVPSLLYAVTAGANSGDVFANDSTVGTIDWSNP